MVKEIKMYQNHFTKKMFDTFEKALESEANTVYIADLFSFWKLYMDYPHTDQYSCVQRTNEQFNKYLDALVVALNKLCRYSLDPIDKKGASNYSLLRSILSWDDPLIDWVMIQSRICPYCLKEFDQPFFAINCNHNGSAYSTTKGLTIWFTVLDEEIQLQG